jgi:hypothetical protein
MVAKAVPFTRRKIAGGETLLASEEVMERIENNALIQPWSLPKNDI